MDSFDFDNATKITSSMINFGKNNNDDSIFMTRLDQVMRNSHKKTKSEQHYSYNKDSYNKKLTNLQSKLKNIHNDRSVILKTPFKDPKDIQFFLNSLNTQISKTEQQIAQIVKEQQSSTLQQSSAHATLASQNDDVLAP